MAEGLTIYQKPSKSTKGQVIDGSLKKLNSSIAGPSWLLLAQARATCYQRSTEGQCNRPKAKKTIINPKKMTKRGRNWPMAKVNDQKAKAIEKKAKVIDQTAKVINPSLTKG